jgi:hypothetical protein
MIPQLSFFIEHCRASAGIRSSFEEFSIRDCSTEVHKHMLGCYVIERLGLSVASTGFVAVSSE